MSGFQGQSRKKQEKKIAEKAKKMGFRGFGAEFLFIETKEATPKMLEKAEKKARDWKRFLEKEFDETRISVHAPWLPYEETSIARGNIGAKAIMDFAGFCQDIVDVINIHIDTSIKTSEWEKSYSTAGQREQARETAVQNLAEFTDKNNAICIETIPIVEEESVGDYLGFIACLPSEMEYFTKKNRKLGITIDTCHTGITIEACRQFLEEKQTPGFYEEDLKEIKEVAKKGDKPYMELGNRIRHLHYSDLSKFGNNLRKAQHGAVPGEGHRSEKEMIGILEQYEKAVGKKSVSATLEINETDYAKLENIEKTLGILRTHQYN